MAGEPFRSVSITAEAGKLPTFNVRPFWPFQVVELGLRKEGENKGGVEAGPARAFSSRAVCGGAASAWRKGSLSLPSTKGLCGRAPARTGALREWSRGLGLEELRGKQKSSQGQACWEGVLLGIRRKQEALTCPR